MKNQHALPSWWCLALVLCAAQAQYKSAEQLASWVRSQRDVAHADAAAAAFAQHEIDSDVLEALSDGATTLALSEALSRRMDLPLGTVTKLVSRLRQQQRPKGNAEGDIAEPSVQRRSGTEPTLVQQASEQPPIPEWKAGIPHSCRNDPFGIIFGCSNVTYVSVDFVDVSNIKLNDADGTLEYVLYVGSSWNDPAVENIMKVCVLVP